VPDFADALEARDGQQVNVVGFMSPIDQFRDAEHFMLLPLPIECFFCNAPPRHYVVLVEMAEGTRAQMVNEPVFISGTLELAQTEAPKFFYRIDNASMRGADEGGGLTPMNTPMEHRMDLMQNIQELQGPMLEGTDAGPADGAAPGSGS
jgi:hypothetical protein